MPRKSNVESKGVVGNYNIVVTAEGLQLRPLRRGKPRKTKYQTLEEATSMANLLTSQGKGGKALQ